MLFPTPLLRGRLLKRYKRFLADVALDGGDIVTASCPNTGSMKGLTGPGSVVWLSTSDSPTRKYRHTWEIIENDLGGGPVLVGINSGLPNRIVAESIEAGAIASLSGYASLRREQKYGRNSRIDILLEDDPAKVGAKPTCYVEIKNVHMMRARGIAEFPDSVTERGAKHLGELADMVREGKRAVMVYLIQREDATAMKLARDIDKAYGNAFDAAIAAGVEAIGVKCRLTPAGIDVCGTIDVAG